MQVHHCAANLERPLLPWEDLVLLVDEDLSTELAQLVLEDELILGELDLSMEPGDGDVVDAQVLVQTTAEFERVDAHDGHQELDHAAHAVVKTEALEHDVVVGRPRDVEQGVLSAVRFEYVRIQRLADLTAKAAPVIDVRGHRRVLELLTVNPVLEAVYVDIGSRTAALAHLEQGVLNAIRGVPAESTGRSLLVFSIGASASLVLLVVGRLWLFAHGRFDRCVLPESGVDLVALRLLLFAVDMQRIPLQPVF